MSTTAPVPGTDLFQSGVNIAASYLSRLMPSADSKNIKHNLRVGAFALSTFFLVASVVNVLSLNILSGIAKAAIGIWLRVVSEQEIKQNPQESAVGDLGRNIRDVWTRCLGTLGLTPESVRIQWNHGLQIRQWYILRT